MGPSPHRIQLGSAEIFVFNDSISQVPYERVVAGVPKEQVMAAVKRAGLPSEDTQLDTNVCLIRTDESTILVDAGKGPGVGDLFRDLVREGVDPKGVDLVIITHTDGDHTGGLLDERGERAFPSAPVVVPRPAWDFWTSMEYLSSQPVDRAELARRTAAGIMAHIRLLPAGSEITPGIRYVDAPGHRPGHMAVSISLGGAETLIIGDAILHMLLVSHPQWHCPFDTYPEIAVETRMRLLETVADSGHLIASTHLPFPGLGRIVRTEVGFEWQPQA